MGWDKKRKLIAALILIGSLVLGIALGMIFKTPDVDLQGRPIEVFDIGLAFTAWLLGPLVGFIVLGKWLKR